MARQLGYIISLIGIVILSLSVDKVRALIPGLDVLSGISNKYILIAGIALLAIGILFLKSSGKGAKGGREVPIYKGDAIVGYRRT